MEDFYIDPETKMVLINNNVVDSEEGIQGKLNALLIACGEDKYSHNLGNCNDCDAFTLIYSPGVQLDQTSSKRQVIEQLSKHDVKATLLITTKSHLNIREHQISKICFAWDLRNNYDEDLLYLVFKILNKELDHRFWISIDTNEAKIEEVFKRYVDMGFKNPTVVGEDHFGRPLPYPKISLYKEGFTIPNFMEREAAMDSIRKVHHEMLISVLQKNIIYFTVEPSALKDLKRDIKFYGDCVISAMQILDLLNNFSANIVRVIAYPRNSKDTFFIGINENQMERIFKRKYPNKNWKFWSFPSIDYVIEYAKQLLPINQGIFVGYKEILTQDISLNFKKGMEMGHVFVIAKDENGKLAYLEPQLSLEMICDLDIEDCLQYIAGKQRYFIMTRHEIADPMEF